MNLGFNAVGEAETLLEGSRSCEWHDDDRSQNLSLTIVTTRDILANTYRARQFALFQPIELGGLPAVEEQSYPGSESCTITVGTAESQGFVVIYDQFRTSADGPCGQGRRIVERIVAALPPLSEK